MKKKKNLKTLKYCCKDILNWILSFIICGQFLDFFLEFLVEEKKKTSKLKIFISNTLKIEFK